MTCGVGIASDQHSAAEFAVVQTRDHWHCVHGAGGRSARGVAAGVDAYCVSKHKGWHGVGAPAGGVLRRAFCRSVNWGNGYGYTQSESKVNMAKAFYSLQAMAQEQYGTRGAGAALGIDFHDDAADLGGIADVYLQPRDELSRNARLQVEAMTFDDDFVQFSLTNMGVVFRQACRDLNVQWPPPERLEIQGFVFKRIRLSPITDEQRAGMTNVCRGAEYEMAHDEEGVTWHAPGQTDQD